MLRQGQHGSRRRVFVAVLVACAPMLVPAFALAHVERSSYWPDPAPDTSVSPPAGGAVPKARSLASALKKKPPGTTRVVCQDDSIDVLKSQISAARKHGYLVR